MSYQEQAMKINRELKDTLNRQEIVDIRPIINTIIRFGQVAKYRCRSNVAYDNFAKICFDGIAELERVQVPSQEFSVLKVKE